MPFAPGQSGNPGGRPKQGAELKAAAREHAQAALQVFVDSLASDDERMRHSAAHALLDRGFGKAVQAVEGTEDGPAIRLDAIVRKIVDPRD